MFCFFFSSRRRHTRCALVTGVQTCALPISYGFARAITKDGDRWYLQPQVTGTLVAPFIPNLNSRGGVGSEEEDNRLVPGVDFNDSIVRDALPSQPDTTPLLGPGPLLTSASLGPITIDATGSGRAAPGPTAQNT